MPEKQSKMAEEKQAGVNSKKLEGKQLITAAMLSAVRFIRALELTYPLPKDIVSKKVGILLAALKELEQFG